MNWSLFFLGILLHGELTAKVILWDLGGVLFEPDKIGVAQEVGLSKFLYHAVQDLRSPDIQPVLFDVLKLLDTDEDERRDVAGSAHGIPLPPIMCKWQAGTITGQEIIDRARPLIKKLYKYDYFDSEAHRDLIWHCIKKMFNPKILSKHVFPTKEGIDLLKESSKLRNSDGTKKHRQFVFSNWDHSSFDSFYEQHRTIFNQFEAIIISGHIKRIKPNRDSFDHLVSTYHLDPADCILIDDQEVNVQAAKEYGMEAVLIRNRNYKKLRKDLIQLGVIE